MATLSPKVLPPGVEAEPLPGLAPPQLRRN